MTVKKSPRIPQGFTIVELLIVIVVIAILATVTIVAYGGIQKRAAEASLQTDLKQASSQLGLYNVENGVYPTDIALVNSNQGLKKSTGTDYQYTYTSGTNSYCITATSTGAGTSAYKFDSLVGSVEPGLCSGHLAPGVPVLTWAALTSGESHNCGIYGTSAYCWGRNNLGFAGQLGNGTTTNSPIPVAVTTSGALSGRTVVDIDAGGSHTCVVVSDGDAFCWGSGANGRLGRNSSSNSAVPVAVTMSGALAGLNISAISVGTFHTCALAGGAPYCWGYNADGQLGNNSTVEALTAVPVDVTGALAGKTVTQISAGTNNTCAVADGLPYCWGANASGQLGDGTTTTALTPVGVNTSGVLAGKTTTQVVAGNTSSCAIADQRVYCWGANANGGLGNTGPSHSYVPSAVTYTGVMSGTTATSLSVSLYGGCAVASALPYCWGTGGSGQLGNGGTINSFAPVQVSTSGVLSGMTATISSSGSGHACVLASGSVYCWGGGLYGRLGNGSSADSSIPVKVTNP